MSIKVDKTIRSNIGNLKPGQNTNETVAGVVLLWEESRAGNRTVYTDGEGSLHFSVPRYSENAVIAFSLLERQNKAGNNFSLIYCGDTGLWHLVEPLESQACAEGGALRIAFEIPPEIGDASPAMAICKGLLWKLFDM